MVLEIKSVDPGSGFELCVYPQESRRKRSNWILWISADGSAQLYNGREESGAVTGKPIMLPANSKRTAQLTEEVDV